MNNLENDTSVSNYSSNSDTSDDDDIESIRKRNYDW